MLLGRYDRLAEHFPKNLDPAQELIRLDTTYDSWVNKGRYFDNLQRMSGAAHLVINGRLAPITPENCLQQVGMASGIYRLGAIRDDRQLMMTSSAHIADNIAGVNNFVDLQKDPKNILAVLPMVETASIYTDDPDLSEQIFATQLKAIPKGIRLARGRDKTAFLPHLSYVVSHATDKIGRVADEVVSLSLDDDLATQSLITEYVDSRLMDKHFFGFDSNAWDVMMDRILSGYGVDMVAIQAAWESSFSNLKNPQARYEIKSRNFRVMMDLERQVQGKGISNLLFNIYGLGVFKRYPEHMLLKQFSSHQDKTTRFGLVLAPEDDHNGTYYNNWPLLESLDAQFQDIALLRMMEAGSPDEIEAIFKKMADLFIAMPFLGVFCGHGDGYSMDLDRGPFSGKLFADQAFFRRLRGYFDFDPTLILSSCFAGIPRGFAQRTSEAGFTVIASPGSLNKMEVNVLNPQLVRPKYDVNYYSDGVILPTKVYRDGLDITDYYLTQSTYNPGVLSQVLTI